MDEPRLPTVTCAAKSSARPSSISHPVPVPPAPDLSTTLSFPNCLFTFSSLLICMHPFQALEALEKLERSVDTLIVIPTDKLLDIADENMPLQDAFFLADDVLHQGVQGISYIITISGLVNVDFAEVKSVMKNSGTAILGVSSSKNRAQEAVEQATLAPLIGSSIEAATGVVYNVTGGKDITLQEVNKVSA